MMKQCSKCHETKDETEFHKDASKRGGIRTYCKACAKIGSATRHLAGMSASPNRNRDKQRNYSGTLNGMFTVRLLHARTHSRRKNIPFNLTKDHIAELYEAQDGLCYWTGIDLELNDQPKHPWAPSLDKLVPMLGYVEGNVVWAAWSINAFRGSQTPDQFRDTLRRVNSVVLPGEN